MYNNHANQKNGQTQYGTPYYGQQQDMNFPSSQYYQNSMNKKGSTTKPATNNYDHFHSYGMENSNNKQGSFQQPHLQDFFQRNFPNRQQQNHQHNFHHEDNFFRRFCFI